MKLGILDAVPSEYLHVDNNIRDAQKFIDLLTDVDFQGQMLVYAVADQHFPPDLGACDAYLITGSPLGVHDTAEWIAYLMDFVRQAHAQQKPMVGICFGHQLIAQALGGQVEYAGWLLGLKGFTLLQKCAWMPPDIQSCQLYHVNKDQVTSLPPDALHLGTSELCPYSMYTIGKHILGIQGHPEQPLRAVHNFMNALGDTVPPETREQAHISFTEGSPDRLMVGRWIRQFLEMAYTP